MNRDEFNEAIRKGELMRVKELIECEPSLVDRGEWLSPILLALYNGRHDVAAFLAGRILDRTLHEAAALGEVDRVRKTLASDPSLVHAFSSDGYALLGFGTFFGHPESDRVVLEFGPDMNAQARNPQRVGAMHAAAAVRDREMMRTLLERGADPNARQQLDYTPLHTAASRGDIEMATLLLEHGADASARGTDGKSAGDVAREHGHPEFAEWLEAR